MLRIIKIKIQQTQAQYNLKTTPVGDEIARVLDLINLYVQR